MISRAPLPADFRDHPRLKRWWYNLMVLLHIRKIKAECCESFRKVDKMVACKGCATLYDRNSASWTYRTIAKLGEKRPPKPTV